MRSTILSFILLAFTFCGCVEHTGSGKLVQKNIEGETFNEIDISGPYEVDIIEGNTCSVVIESDDNIIGLTDVYVNGNTLMAKIKEGTLNNAHLKLMITLPELHSIKGSASAAIHADLFTSKEKLEISLSSSASLKGNIDVPETVLKASSGSTIKLDGKTRTLKVNASSSGEVDAIRLLSETTTVNASSGASVAVYASVGLKADASSGADIVYSGNGVVDKNTSSGGSVEKQ